MTNIPQLLEQLEKSVCLQDTKEFHRIMAATVKSGIAPSQIEEGLLRGLDRIRKRLLSNESSLPELLISLDLTTAGLGLLKKTATGASKEENPVSIVMGVVEGDPHDLGKNIISLIYQSYGFRVVDLGTQVPNEIFIGTVSEQKPEVLALSAMMSTTMTRMPEIIEEAKRVSPNTRVMVGGAPLDDKLAASYGADGYAESAVTVIEQTQTALKTAGIVFG